MAYTIIPREGRSPIVRISERYYPLNVDRGEEITPGHAFHAAIRLGRYGQDVADYLAACYEAGYPCLVGWSGIDALGLACSIDLPREVAAPVTEEYANVHD